MKLLQLDHKVIASYFEVNNQAKYIKLLINLLRQVKKIYNLMKQLCHFELR